MTKKKPTSIDKHKEKDLNLGRDKLISVIDNVDPATCSNATMIKNMIEAVKLLARMHKALQVDKVIAKAEAKQIQQAVLKKPKLKPELQEKLNNLLNAPTAS